LKVVERYFAFSDINDDGHVDILSAATTGIPILIQTSRDYSSGSIRVTAPSKII